MKTLYIECAMGAAGDMLMAALLELMPLPDEFVQRLNALSLPQTRFERLSTEKCGIHGTRVSVKVSGTEEESQDVSEHLHEHAHAQNHDHGHSSMQYRAQEHLHTQGQNHEHTHRDGSAHSHEPTYSDLGDIEHLLESLPLSERVRADVKAVYALLAEAEAHVHGLPVKQVHFHEVGAMDAVADIVGVSMLMEAIAPDEVVVSPVHVGFGQVQCAHGILPVPAPATAHILRGVPTYGGTVRGELCTPTGAALLKHFATSFGPMPTMTVTSIGYGMGKKDFEAANCIRAFVGERYGEESMDEIVMLSCNLDDMTGEAVGFATEKMFEGGALDVFLTSIQMKKNRPGQLLTCICTCEQSDTMAKLMLRHTSTFGVRKSPCQRYRLDRSLSVADTPFGPIHIKKGYGFGVTKTKPEYEDVAAAARSCGVSLADVMNALDKPD